MSKKITLIALVVAIVIQLFVPLGMIAYCKQAESNLDKYGEEYKIEIDVYSIHENTVIFHLKWGNWYTVNEYGLIGKTADGYDYFYDFTDNRPPIHNYVRFTENNMRKLMRYETDMNTEMRWVDGEKAYAIIKVFNGDMKVLGIYIDEIPVEEWVKIPPPTEEYITEENIFENT